MPQLPPGLADQPDRIRWNARYQAAGYQPPFTPHPLAVRALAASDSDSASGPPPGPVLDLACGPSGSALLAAARGRQVVAVDASEVALRLLAAEARARGLADLLSIVQADLGRWRPEPDGYAIVLCTGYWDRDVFAAAALAVRAGGVLGWEALTLAARAGRPQLPEQWCLRPGEPAALLPPDFGVIGQDDVGPEPAAKRRLLARRRMAEAGP